ncbi:CPBP family intramembrane glutamic endopeptidase [Opitutus terrae]|uniref:Abortive infection protein n=1 Tax=Opitutus terrae (strain DSM 11246 / JCM 15787 / PB90-1) TaxID=452637 RepID=B1ZTI2_OPITP|nr:CPBP family intramembrane glutamic endopeptidase [Opitutus terrae]ACB73927.1 Abortive infection protein [Opitutus terrae PB90-1]
MTDHPLLLLLLIGAGLYIGKLWLDDARAARAGRPNPRAFPGATPTQPAAVLIAVGGVLVLLAVETVGEHVLGLSAEQSHITGLFAFYTLVAAVFEEIIFRGYIVVEGRGPGWRWIGVLAASVVFAALHPFLWRWNEAGFAFTLTGKGAFSTSVVFATSLWLYVARFAYWNPTRSLWPCIAAHAAKNAGVIAIKAAQGFVVGAW